MNPEEIPLVQTWGRRLNREAQHLAACHLPELPWLQQLALVAQRLVALPVPQETRFRRVEATGPRRPAPVAQPQPVEATGLQWPAPVAQPQPPAEDIGAPLAPHIRQRLESLTGPGLQTMRLHLGPAADELAQTHHADAVAVDQDVYFRSGRYRPEEPAGLALLAHEAEHILQALRPNAAWQRATTAGRQAEENQALVREREVYQAQGLAVPPPPPGGVWSLPMQRPTLEPPPLAAPAPPAALAQPPLAAATPAQRPMTAAADRNLAAAGPAQGNAWPDLETLRRELHRDLMNQIRADLERGA